MSFKNCLEVHSLLDSKKESKPVYIFKSKEVFANGYEIFPHVNVLSQ